MPGPGSAVATTMKPGAKSAASQAAKRRLTFNDTHALSTLPKRIERHTLESCAKISELGRLDGREQAFSHGSPQ